MQPFRSLRVPHEAYDYVCVQKPHSHINVMEFDAFRHMRGPQLQGMSGFIQYTEGGDLNHISEVLALAPQFEVSFVCLGTSLCMSLSQEVRWIGTGRYSGLNTVCNLAEPGACRGRHLLSVCTSGARRPAH
jgi:hypothetical protein